MSSNVGKETKVLEGIVISDKMDKTIVVKVDRRVTHPVYKKVITRSTKYQVHDEDGKCKTGDKVRIRETRPISKLKSWTLHSVVGE